MHVRYSGKWRQIGGRVLNPTLGSVFALGDIFSALAFCFDGVEIEDSGDGAEEI
jgi:hypothetical protein